MASLGQATRLWPGRICGNLDEPSKFELVSPSNCFVYHALSRSPAEGMVFLDLGAKKVYEHVVGNRTDVPQCQSTSWRSCEIL